MQADLQAQARAHRIGQTKGVFVLRLASRGPPVLVPSDDRPSPASRSKSTGGTWRYARSVEELMLARAAGKIETEAAVIGRGGFTHSHHEFGGNGGALMSSTKAGMPASHRRGAGMLIGDMISDALDSAGDTTPGLNVINNGDSRSVRALEPFAPLPSADLLAVCARDTCDATAFAMWQHHCQSLCGSQEYPLYVYDAEQQAQAAINTERDSNDGAHPPVSASQQLTQRLVAPVELCNLPLREHVLPSMLIPQRPSDTTTGATALHEEQTSAEIKRARRGRRELASLAPGRDLRNGGAAPPQRVADYKRLL